MLAFLLDDDLLTGFEFAEVRVVYFVLNMVSWEVSYTDAFCGDAVGLLRRPWNTVGA